MKENNKTFKVEPNLITIDAPDGSGKGTIAKHLTKKLKEKYGNNNVLLISPTRFDESDSAKKFGIKVAEIKNLKNSSRKHNSCYMAALAHNYRDVISQKLTDGKIIIADSSEIRSLAFISDIGKEEAVSSTIRWIKSGRATNKIISGNRLLLNTSPEDCLANIKTRGKCDYGDPTNINEAVKRQNCYYQAINLIKNLETDSPVNWVEVQNDRYTDNSIDEHINQLINQTIIPRLKLK